MKYSKTIGRIVTSLLPLLVLASASFAATNPLANPFGMAVDAKGNLWVANGRGPSQPVCRRCCCQATPRIAHRPLS
jgi:hypothetical protein